MKNIITFSGGKDSLASIIWATRNLNSFEVIFCDTGWEHEKTYQHIKDVEQYFGIEIKRLVSSRYSGFEDLSKKKGRVASTKARFCTEELKIKPTIDYILSHKEDITIYQGIRADESNNRSKMKIKDEYFKFYFEPYRVDDKGKKHYHNYRKKEVIEYCDKYSVDVFRPIFLLSAQDVFDEIRRAGIQPNPLYKDGFARVGCFPCVNCNHGELKIMAQRYPERIDFLRRFEQENDFTFLPPGYIPAKFCSKKVGDKLIPTIDDVVKYLYENENQLFERSACQSIYNICE